MMFRWISHDNAFNFIFHFRGGHFELEEWMTRKERLPDNFAFPGRKFKHNYPPESGKCKLRYVCEINRNITGKANFFFIK